MRYLARAEALQAAAGSSSPDFPALLAICGMKVTTARLQLLELFAGGASLDFHAVCRALDDNAIHLPPGTVQRVLCDLCANGLLERDAPAGTPGVRFTRRRPGAGPQ